MTYNVQKKQSSLYGLRTHKADICAPYPPPLGRNAAQAYRRKQYLLKNGYKPTSILVQFCDYYIAKDKA
jgi:hypothetical protein